MPRSSLSTSVSIVVYSNWYPGRSDVGGEGRSDVKVLVSPSWGMPNALRHTIPAVDTGEDLRSSKMCMLKKSNSGRLRNDQSLNIVQATGLADGVVVIAGMQLWFKRARDPELGSMAIGSQYHLVGPGISFLTSSSPSRRPRMSGETSELKQRVEGMRCKPLKIRVPFTIQTLSNDLFHLTALRNTRPGLPTRTWTVSLSIRE